MNISHVALGLAVIVAALPLKAQTPPARRPGLWEVHQGPIGGPLGPAVRVCMTAADAGGEFRGLSSSPPFPGSTCEYKRISASASEVRWRNVCKFQGDTLTMEGRGYDIAPEAFKVDMKMSGLGDSAGGTVHAEARWVSAECPTTK